MKLLAWCTALLLLLGVAVGLDRTDHRPDPAAGPAPGGATVEAAGLRSFSDCDELVAYFRTTALVSRTAGLALGRAGPAEESAAGAGATADGGADAATAAGPGFSGTNLQEAEVDEPDLVKTDGEVIVAVAGGRLQVLDPDGPRLLGTLALPEGSSQLLLSGDRVLVITSGWQHEDRPAVSDGAVIDMVAGRGVTTVTSVDIAEPTTPRVLATRTLDGDHLSARMVGTTARLVLRSSPQLAQPEPRLEEGRDAEGDGEASVAGAIADAPLSAWLPSDGDGPVVACDAVSRPAEPAGVGTVTVLTYDVAGSLEPLDATAIVADADTVYASADRLYVATTSWPGWCCGPMPVEGDGGIGDTSVSSDDPPAGEAPRVATEVHAFDTTGTTTRHLGSGRVEGRLLNSFSLSEHEGTLRVAVTIDDLDGRAPSESAVVTLVEEGGALVERGRLAGLGTTEQIYAVRYQGDVAYVVTFRQTDPLYTIDLSDPAAPRLLGELKIPGYSAYLHPVEPGRLVGVGQDASDDGQTQGSQVSTFDVSDLAAPAEEARLSFPGSSSPVEYDHRAFLWWPEQRLAVVPLETWGDGGDGRPAAPSLSAVGVEVGADGSLRERGRVTHQDKVGADAYPAITRSLVVGDTLFTVSEVGLLASDVTTLAERGWVAL